MLDAFVTLRSGDPGQVGGAVTVRQRNIRPREPGSPERAARPPSGEEQNFREEERNLVSRIEMINYLVDSTESAKKVFLGSLNDLGKCSAVLL